jgi:hypothetical protein
MEKRKVEEMKLLNFLKKLLPNPNCEVCGKELNEFEGSTCDKCIYYQELEEWRKERLRK